jgi:hemoglobin
MPHWRGRDLDDPDEIAEMVRRFYADVAQDDLLGPMFNDVAQVDWCEHLPKLTAFWCRALLAQPGYEGNPYRAHMLVHTRRPFTRAHFERWLELFHETLDLGWSGPRVEQAKSLARKVAMVHSKQIIGDPVEYAPATPASVGDGHREGGRSALRA